MKNPLLPKGRVARHVLAFLLSFWLLSEGVLAQNLVVSGTVTVDNQESIPGVNILVKGTNFGTISDFEGRYTIEVPSPESVLVFSFVGYNPQEVPVGGRTTIDVSMTANTLELSEVVVTALGVERETRALGYAVQEVKGERLTQAREPNLVNSLSGQVAGVQVVGSSTTIGGSSRVTIRGESSLDINANQPLFVVDGIPVSNQVVGSSGSGNLEVDYGNAAGEINPDDIESISVLKGPAAAALYGARAANGAILIKTKSGKSTKGMGVSVNVGVSFENPLRLPDWQDVYGQGNNGQFEFFDGSGGGIADGVDESWGPRMDQGTNITQFDSPRLDANGNLIPFRGGDLNAPDGSTIEATPWISNPNNIDDFFETGVTQNYNVALTSSSEKGNVRLSWTRQDQKGMVPNTNLIRNTIALNSGMDLTEKLRVNAAINYQRSESDNRPAISYGTESLMYLWIWYGRQINTNNLRNYWQPGLEGVQQFNYNYNYHDNPYFTTFENTNGQQKDRIFGNVSATYQFTDELSLMVRAGTDFYTELRDRKRAFSTQRFPLGMYREDDVLFREINTDFLLSYNKNLNDDWGLNVSVGGNAMRQDNDYTETVAPELLIPGVYSFTNSRVQLQIEQLNQEKRINSLYGFAQVSFRNIIFLDITGRNDWSSTLPSNNNSYFYPSVTLSTVISDMIALPPQISFAKIRAAYAEVGNDTNPFNLTNVFTPGTAWGNFQSKTEEDRLKNANLKPERTSSYELGADIRLFAGRLGLDFTYYDNRTKDQIIPVAIDVSTGYVGRVINAGEIKNNGIELVLYGQPFKATDGFNWDISVNYTRSRSEVLELPDEVEAYSLTPSRGGAIVQAREGERMGAIYGVGFKRVEDEDSDFFGEIIHSKDGTPLRDSELKLQGNYNPDWMAGIRNTFSWKGISVGVLFDIRQGGIVVSRTKTIGSTSGQLEETLFGRPNGYDLSDPANGVISQGVIENDDGSFRPNDVKISSRNWHNRYYERNNVEAAKYDASFTKLREVIIGYTFPNKLWGDLPFKDVRLSLVARNLALWTENPHFDPETVAMSGGTLVPGVEYMSYPSPRSYGFNLNFNL